MSLLVSTLSNSSSSLHSQQTRVQSLACTLRVSHFFRDSVGQTWPKSANGGAHCRPVNIRRRISGLSLSRSFLAGHLSTVHQKPNENVSKNNFISATHACLALPRSSVRARQGKIQSRDHITDSRRSSSSSTRGGRIRLLVGRHQLKREAFRSEIL